MTPNAENLTSLFTGYNATFNKAMSPDSINTNTFTLQCPAGEAIGSSVSYDANSRVATLSPAAHLPVSTLCTATITTGTRVAARLSINCVARGGYCVPRCS